MKKKSKALDLELTSSSILIETGGKKMKKLLIIYYSWSNGNTERIAKMLQSETDSDILKIDTVVPYSGSYDDVVNQGQNEVQRGYNVIKLRISIVISSTDIHYVLRHRQLPEQTCGKCFSFQLFYVRFLHT